MEVCQYASMQVIGCNLYFAACSSTLAPHHSPSRTRRPRSLCTARHCYFATATLLLLLCYCYFAPSEGAPQCGEGHPYSHRHPVTRTPTHPVERSSITSLTHTPSYLVPHPLTQSNEASTAPCTARHCSSLVLYNSLLITTLKASCKHECGRCDVYCVTT